jgi:hypothetical protein
MVFSQTRDNIQKLSQIKEEKRFLGKRDRLLRSGWRHGIVGIEDPDMPKSKVYLDKQAEMHRIQKEKNSIIAHR